ncbi:MAG: hypothetical protein MJ091_00235 [Clostridia bacterium]|nr:hypothetical protein [Clostridia bacterium]
MNLFTLILASVLFFAVGFILGLTYEGPKKAPQRIIDRTESAVIKKLNGEYRNFLSYDGTNQI